MRRLPGFLALLVCGLVFPLGALQAGSVFMKNGYIIQGPIVDQSDESIVLGWENGKVTIHRRFVESVTFDPGEQQRLEELERARREGPAQAEESVIEALDSDDQDDLPADLSVMLSLYKFDVGNTPSIPDITSVSDPLGSDDSTDPEMVSPDGSDDTLDPEVSVVDPAVPELTERVYSDGGQFSIKVPVGWEVKKLENTLQVVGPAGENGVTPSFNVMSVSTGGLSFGECVALLQEEQSSALQQFEVLTQGGLTLNDRQAYEIIARGSMDGKVLVLRQVLVPGDDESVVLFSGYSVGASEDSTFSQIEAALQSLESVE